jgi:hypothetical protein
MEGPAMATHADPVWRDRSDFLIAADISAYSSDVGAPDREQIWARRLDASTFEICCIPFFVYDLALADIVETGSAGDRQYIIERVVRSMGRFVFRVWFGSSFFPRGEVATRLLDVGALIEWSSLNLLAIDASDEEMARAVAAVLQAHEDAGHLEYETGRTR